MQPDTLTIELLTEALLAVMSVGPESYNLNGVYYQQLTTIAKQTITTTVARDKTTTCSDKPTEWLHQAKSTLNQLDLSLGLTTTCTAL